MGYKDIINEFLSEDNEENNNDSKSFIEAIAILRHERIKKSQELRKHLNTLAQRHNPLILTMDNAHSNNEVDYLERIMRAALNNNAENGIGQPDSSTDFVPDDVIRQFLSSDDDDSDLGNTSD